MVIKKNSYVRIRKTILEPIERSSNLPIETQKVPFIMWVKGYLLEDGKINQKVQIKTETSRIETGILIEVEPSYTHDYGNFIPEILKISEIIKDEMYGNNHE